MANTFVTLKQIARQALPRLIDNLVFPNLVHRDFSDDFHDLGDTIRVRRPVMLTAEDFDAASGVNYQDIQEDAVEVKLDHLATVDAAASAIETATGIDDLNRVFIEPAAAVKVNGAVTAGATQLSIDGTSLTGKLVKGDVLVIGGKSYVVTEDSAAAAGNAIANVKVYPALPQIADNADVTLVGSHTANLAFHPMAFAYVTRPLHNPDGEGVASYVTSYDGISLRVTKGYDQKYKRSIYSMDVLYGFKTVYPELAVRALG